MGTYWDAFMEEIRDELAVLSIAQILERYHRWLLAKAKNGERIFPF